MKKLFLVLFLTAAAVNLVAAQDVSTAESNEIVLPDVQSTLGTTEIDINPDAIPDFSLVLPLERVGLPVIKEPDITEAPFESFTTSVPEESAKDIFMEASLGLGFRSLFSGDFSVYRSTGTIPFVLGFSHETSNGFGEHSASEGFNQAETSIQGDTEFSLNDSLAVSAAADYRTGSYGLQGNSISFYNMNHEAAVISGNATYAIIPAVTVSAGGEMLYLSQFASLSPSLSGDERDAAVAVSRISGVWFTPCAGFTVSGNSWSAGLSVVYGAGTNQSRTRADLSFSMNWNDMVQADASVGVVISANSTTQTVYPFCISVGTGKNAEFSLTAAGGLKTTVTDLSELQATYPFMFTGIRQYEESAWFGTVDFLVPVKSYGSVTVGAQFEKTAFGNNRLLPDLNTDTQSAQGLYQLQLQDYTALSTSLGCAVPFSNFALSLDWNAAWLDNLFCLKPANLISTGLSYTSESGQLGALTEVGVSLSDSRTPYWDISAFYRVSNALKLEVAGIDVLKFFADRELCPGYISRGGCVTLSANIYF